MSSIFFTFFTPIIFALSFFPSMLRADSCHNFSCNHEVESKEHILSVELSDNHNYKLYLNPESIAFNGNRILVNIDQEWISVSMLQCNEQGYFVESKDLPLGYWNCPNSKCRAVNPPWHIVCWKCGM